MAVTEPADAREPEEQIDPDVPLPSQWSAEMKKILDELEKLQRAKGLFAGSSVIESGDDYQTADYLLSALEHSLRAEFATLLVQATKDLHPRS